MLMALAIVTVLILVNIVASISLAYWKNADHVLKPFQLHALVTIGTLLLIGLSSWWKHRELACGGPALAVQLGGREILPATADAGERKLRAVVEEMAIAAGIPVPAVFLLDSDGINAFAAGNNLRDSAVAVTRGCLMHLNRDELQAIVAHETSHLLNGDARLNMHLMSAIHGLMSVSHAGRMLSGSWSHTGYSGNLGSRRRRDGRLAAIGLALIAIGYVGSLLGELVRAGVSRQREFLADAAAVQFTRNGNAVANALKQALRPEIGSRVSNQHTALASHLFFAAPASFFSGWLASHPPLVDRIRRVEPTWDGKLSPSRQRSSNPETTSEAKSGIKPGLAPGMVTTTKATAAQLARNFAAEPLFSTAATRPPAAPGNSRPMPMQVAFAAELLGQIPEALSAAASEAYGGRAVVLVTMLSRNTPDCQAQVAHIREMDAPLADLVLRLLPAWRTVNPTSVRLPLLQLAMPNLRRLTMQQRQDWLALVSHTAALGEPIARLFNHLVQNFFKDQRPAPDFHSLEPLREDLCLALGIIAKESDAPAHTFAAGWARLHIAGTTPDLPSVGDIDVLSTALARLARANGAIRRRLVEAIAESIAADGRVSPQEAELLRLSCAILGTPLPLLRDFMSA